MYDNNLNDTIHVLVIWMLNTICTNAIAKNKIDTICTISVVNFLGEKNIFQNYYAGAVGLEHY